VNKVVLEVMDSWTLEYIELWEVLKVVLVSHTDVSVMEPTSGV